MTQHIPMQVAIKTVINKENGGATSTVDSEEEVSFKRENMPSSSILVRFEVEEDDNDRDREDVKSVTSMSTREEDEAESFV